MLNERLNALSYQIDIAGLDLDGTITPNDPTDDITGLHIHSAPAGVEGEILFGIHEPQHDGDDQSISFPGSGVVRFEGVWDEFDVRGAGAPARISNPGHQFDLQTESLYLDVHTLANPAGDIRGQIVPEPSTFVLAAFGIVSLLAYAWRRRRYGTV